MRTGGFFLSADVDLASAWFLSGELDAAHENLNILRLIHAVVVHRVAVSDELPFGIPIAYGEWCNAHEVRNFLDHEILFWHMKVS